MGIVAALGSIVALYFYLKTKNNGYLGVFIILTITVLFTYSRASYLAITAGIAVLSIIIKDRRRFLAKLLLLFLITIAFLPRPFGEGVRLERVQSVRARVVDYQQTVEIFSDHPVFGIGYNNLCTAKAKYFTSVDAASNACAGSDSSLLFVLATTGVVGFLVFIDALYQISKDIKGKQYSALFFAIAASALVHSLFSNSLFYPWILGLLAVIMALSFTESKSPK
jgi:O-antigen ligase